MAENVDLLNNAGTLDPGGSYLGREIAARVLRLELGQGGPGELLPFGADGLLTEIVFAPQAEERTTYTSTPGRKEGDVIVADSKGDD